MKVYKNQPTTLHGARVDTQLNRENYTQPPSTINKWKRKQKETMKLSRTEPSVRCTEK